MNPDEQFTMGDWVAREHLDGDGDSVSNKLPIMMAHLVTGVYENSFLRLLDCSEPVDPQYLGFATARAIVEAKRRYLLPIV